MEVARHMVASGVEVLAVFLAMEVQGEVRSFGVAAQRAAQTLFTRTHGVLTRVLAAET